MTEHFIGMQTLLKLKLEYCPTYRIKYRIKGGFKFNSLIIFSDKCLCVCTQAWVWVWVWIDRQKGQKKALVPNNPTSSLTKPCKNYKFCRIIFKTYSHLYFSSKRPLERDIKPIFRDCTLIFPVRALL